MLKYTPSQIRDIFYKIAFGEMKHGKFLRNLSQTVISADGNNLKILQPALEEIIEKYNLDEIIK